MSRCYICDYSPSAASTYYSGLQLRHNVEENRVVFNKRLGHDVCLQCQQDLFDQNNYWSDIDGVTEDFNAFIPDEEPVSEYQGCTDKPTD